MGEFHSKSVWLSLFNRCCGALFLLSFAAMGMGMRGIEGHSIYLESGMTAAEAETVQADLVALDRMNLGLAEDSLPALVFGGAQGFHLGEFLDKRIDYLISPVRGKAADAVEFKTGAGKTTGQIVAHNLGTALWISGMKQGVQSLIVEIDDRAVPITGPEVGIVRLGQAFFGMRGHWLAQVPETHRIQRLGTLMHEARHSDCSVRPAGAVIPATCGYSHSVCPKGHYLAGIPACDVVPWGPYFVQGVFGATVSLACSNCSKHERRLAKAISLDALSRMDIGLLNGMLQGKHGLPVR